MNNNIKLYLGDCLEIMPTLEDKSVDMILCDLPYGTTACKWDTIIPFESLWEQYKRLIKDNGAVVLFGNEPFSSYARLSNIKWYKYDWYWQKKRPSGYINAKHMPLKDIESISVFSKGSIANGTRNNMLYFPQNLKDCHIKWTRPKHYFKGDKGINPTRKSHKLTREIKKKGYPRQILQYSNPNYKLLHPTQKPVALFEYLIKTYTNEGDLVLDNCLGSGTTAVACKNLNRRCIGIEKEEKYMKIAVERLKKV